MCFTQFTSFDLEPKDHVSGYKVVQKNEFGDGKLTGLYDKGTLPVGEDIHAEYRPIHKSHMHLPEESTYSPPGFTFFPRLEDAKNYKGQHHAYSTEIWKVEGKGKIRVGDNRIFKYEDSVILCMTAEYIHLVEKVG